VTVDWTHENLFQAFRRLFTSLNNLNGDFVDPDNGIHFRDLRIVSGSLCRDKSTYSHYHCGSCPDFSFCGAL